MAQLTPRQHYEIRVRGHPGPTLRHAFADLRVDTRDGDAVLRRDLADQPARHGLPAQIEALGVELLEVRRLPDAPSGE
jgi:hypothetical protein